MQAQVTRCKGIVSGILLSAGEARGDSPVETTVRTFLDDLVTEWRATRPVGEVDYENRFGADLDIISDSALKQMICNVLDNALEASPRWVGFEVTHEGDCTEDGGDGSGPGFAPEMLAQFGKPLSIHEGAAGRGPGAVSGSECGAHAGWPCGGRNRDEGGAMVTLTLPLAAITLEEEEGEVDGD